MEFLSYTKKWVDSVNRGGLFRVNESVYLFFRRVEHVTRTFLDLGSAVNYRDHSLKSKMLTALQKSASVISGWDILSQDLDSTLAASLFLRVLESYVDIRCRSYVSVYMFLRKKNDVKVSKKGEKSLRKRLKKT